MFPTRFSLGCVLLTAVILFASIMAVCKAHLSYSQLASIEYTVSIPDTMGQEIHVKMIVRNIPAGKDSVFRIRSPHPINFLVTDLKGRVLSFKVRSLTSRLGIPYIKVRIPSSEGLIIEYSICGLSFSALIFTGRGWGYIGKDFGITLEAQLLLSPGWGWMEYGYCYKVKESRIVFKLPDNWVAVMNHRELGDNVFVIDGAPAELPGMGPDRRSGGFTAFGPFSKHVRSFDGHALIIAIHKDVKYYEPLVEAVLKLIRHYREVFGGNPVLKKLLVIVLPKQAGEVDVLGGMYAEALIYEIVKTNEAAAFGYFQLVNFASHIPTFWLRDFGVWVMQAGL